MERSCSRRHGIARQWPVGMFRGAGGIEALKSALAPVLTPRGFPADLLPLVLVRPLSGSATTALFADIAQRLGPDSLTTRMAGTISGSTETTFYVIAVYFGSIAVRRARRPLISENQRTLQKPDALLNDPRNNAARF